MCFGDDVWCSVNVCSRKIPREIDRPIIRTSNSIGAHTFSSWPLIDIPLSSERLPSIRALASSRWPNSQMPLLRRHHPWHSFRQTDNHAFEQALLHPHVSLPVLTRCHITSAFRLAVNERDASEYQVHFVADNDFDSFVKRVVRIHFIHPRLFEVL